MAPYHNVQRPIKPLTRHVFLQQAIEASKKLANPVPPPSPEYTGVTTFSTANYVIDDVVLSERGMMTLKSQTVEREKPKRRKRAGMIGDIDDMVPGISGGNPSADNSMENDPDDDEDLMPPPTPG
jgi:hypothetical protein